MREAEIQKGSGRLPGVAMALEGSVERITEFGLLFPVHVEREVADMPPRTFQLEGDLKPGVRNGDRLDPLLIDKRLCLRFGQAAPALVPGDLGVVAVSEQGREVGQLEVAKDEAWCFKSQRLKGWLVGVAHVRPLWQHLVDARVTV